MPSPQTMRRSYGTGSLYARADANGQETWYGQFRSNGRQVKRRIGLKRAASGRDGLTRSQAEAEFRRVIATATVSPPVRGDALTIAQLGDRYVEHLRHQGRKKSTITSVRSVLDRWLVPHFGERALDRIQPEDVLELMRRMEAGGVGRRAGKPVGPKSIRNYIGTLSALFNYAERRSWATRNPARHVDLPGVERNEDVRFLEPVEVDALATNAAPGPYEAIDRALYLTAAMTGLRQGELVALRWRDVDWIAGRVRVRQNYVLGEFGTPKSRRSTRSVPMADAVAGELDRLHQARGEPDDDALVFADPHTAGPMNNAAILRRYRKALRAARLDPSHRFHDLRHTFGTRMAAAGVPMRTLQEWMGHRDISTTQRYADYAPSAQEAALVAAAFGRGNNGGNNLSESERISENLTPGITGDLT